MIYWEKDGIREMFKRSDKYDTMCHPTHSDYVEMREEVWLLVFTVIIAI